MGYIGHISSQGRSKGLADAEKECNEPKACRRQARAEKIAGRRRHNRRDTPGGKAEHGGRQVKTEFHLN